MGTLNTGYLEELCKKSSLPEELKGLLADLLPAYDEALEIVEKQAAEIERLKKEATPKPDDIILQKVASADRFRDNFSNACSAFCGLLEDNALILPGYGEKIASALLQDPSVLPMLGRKILEVTSTTAVSGGQPYTEAPYTKQAEHDGPQHPRNRKVDPNDPLLKLLHEGVA